MLKIRPIQPGDAAAVKDLIAGIVNGEFPKESKVYAYQDLDDPVEHYGGERDIFLVAEKDGGIVGTVAIKDDGSGGALLRRIFVRKDCRGQGYGAKLLNKAMEFCFSHDYGTVTFRGTDRMRSALKLCLKSGFQRQEQTDFDDFKLIVLTKRI